MVTDVRPSPARDASPSPWWLALLVLPLAGLALLIAVPDIDLEWQHQPSHFWIVLASAALSAVLAYATHAAAARHRDARVILVSLAFLAAAGFLGLHALATPGVLLHGPNTGFTIATPVGLTVASVFAALSVTSIGGPGAAAVLRWRRALLGATLAAVAAWGLVSVAGLPPLDGPSRSSASRSSAGPRGGPWTCTGRGLDRSPSRSPWVSCCSRNRWSPSR